MKSFLFLPVLVLIFGTLPAQIQQVQQTQNAIRSIDAIGTAPNKSAPMVRGFDNSYKGIIGTPYLSDQWSKGMLEQANGDLFHDVQLRFDMVNDLIEMKNFQGSTVILTMGQINAFRIYSTAETFVTFKVFPEPNPKKKGNLTFYAQVMNEGAIQLLIRRSKYFIPKADATSPYHSNTNDTYKFRADKYYVMLREEETPRRLKRTTKSILTIMEKHQEEMEEFIKRNRLSVSDDYHLALIIDHYNKLEEGEEEE